MIRGRFSFDALATCQQPAIKHFPVHAEGTARLKPGKRQYTFYDNVGVAYCSKPQVTHAECTPF